MTEKVKDVEINFYQVLDIFGGVLGKMLISAKKDQAKAVFKDLKQGKVLSVGEIKQSEQIKFACKVKMDHSEFVGPGFNYDIFRVALGGLLQQIGASLKAKKEIKIMPSEQGLQLVAVPGAVRAHDQDNVLMLALEFAKDASIVAHLMFMDPEQFKQVAEEEGEHTTETPADESE